MFNGTIFFRAYSNVYGEGLWKLDPITTSLVSVDIATEDLTVYPNPSTDDFTIESKNEISIVITNILGETILSQQLQQGKNKINLSDHASGVYFIKNNNSTFKIIKQ